MLKNNCKSNFREDALDAVDGFIGSVHSSVVVVEWVVVGVVVIPVGSGNVLSSGTSKLHKGSKQWQTVPS